MKYRVIPMTERSPRPSRRYRHLRGELVLYADEGSRSTSDSSCNGLAGHRSARVSEGHGRSPCPPTYLLLSHLAMRGAPALSIQRLAGHEDMQTTLGYMHLAQGETERAIRLLDLALARRIQCRLKFNVESSCSLGALARVVAQWGLGSKAQVACPDLIGLDQFPCWAS